MMTSFFKKPLTIALIFVIVVGLGLWAYFALRGKVSEPIIPPVQQTMQPQYKVIGSSVEGRKIESYTYGTGPNHLLFVGGIHGGYEWNSVLLAYQFMDFLDANPSAIPANISVAVVPSANPDAVFRVVGKEGRFVAADATTTVATLEAARFNLRGIDLNRNFDCKWKPQSTWRSKTVSAGTTAFSEPEAQAIRSIVSDFKPKLAVFWHSQASAVYASECENGILPATLTAMNAYATAAGYRAIETFDSYEVSGDAEGWLASIGIPAITVELTTHEATEWDKNLAGIRALFAQYD